MKTIGNIKGEREAQNTQPKRTWPAKAGMAAAGVALLLTGILIYAAYIYDAVYPNVYVNGVAVGKLSEAAAQQKIESELEPAYTEGALPIGLGDENYTVTAKEVKAGIDAAAAAQQAYACGRTGGVFARFGTVVSLLFSKKDIDAGFYIDSETVDKLAQNISDDASTPKKDASYSVEETGITIEPGVTGLEYDVQALSAQMTERFRAHDFSQLTLSPVVTQPASIDLDKLYADTYLEAADAKVSEEDGRNTILPHIDGRSFDKELAKQLLEKTAGERTFIPFIIKKAQITKKQLEAVLFRDVLASTSTKLTNPGLVNRTHNVRLAAGFVNGKILQPDEIFSYNNTVGRRTPERGFRDAKVFVKGEIVDDVGGGICQVSSTLYMASLFADLEITERRNHSFTVDYTKLGEDATVYYGSVDFRFKNNTPYPIKIECALEGAYVYVKIYGTKTEEKTVSIERSVYNKVPFEKVEKPDESIARGARKIDVYGHTGYTVETYRVVKDEKGAVLRKTFEAKSVYKKLDEVILRNPADIASTSPTPTPSIQPTPTPSAEPTPEPTPSTEPSQPPEETTPPSAEPSVPPSTEPSGEPSPDDIYNWPV